MNDAGLNLGDEMNFMVGTLQPLSEANTAQNTNNNTTNLENTSTDSHSETRLHCKYCGKQFAATHKVIRHERTHTGEKPFKCRLCGKGFATTGNLTVHRRIHTGEKPYKCALCDYGFSDRANLIHHQRKYHKML